jgi:hypothetical protein
VIAPEVVKLNSLSSEIDPPDHPIVVEWLKLALAMKATSDGPDADEVAFTLGEHLFVHSC